MVAALRSLLALAAGFVVLAMAFFVSHWLVYRPAGWEPRAGVAVLVAAQSLAALLAARGRGTLPLLLLPGAVGLVALGAYGIATQLDPHNPDPEGYILLASLGAIAEGGITLLLLVVARRRVEPARR